MLVFNKSIYYGTKINHSLIIKNQIRRYGIDIWDNLSNGIRNIEIYIDGEVDIPLNINGTNI